MKHYDVETLGAYIDGELDRETVKTLETDLRNDPDLRRQVTELRAISSALREWCTAQVRPQAAAWPFAMTSMVSCARRERGLAVRHQHRSVREPFRATARRGCR